MRDVDATDRASVTFYWRPGCPFCYSLERKLRKAGVDLDKKNIWEDPADAAAVRDLANGNETVPTVVIHATGTSLVNPRPKQVLALLDG